MMKDRESIATPFIFFLLFSVSFVSFLGEVLKMPEKSGRVRIREENLE